jgi:hypothetical protein
MILAILLRPFSFIAPKMFSYMAFLSFDFECHLMKVIQEARCERT